jgi:hypothetical protein
LNPGPPRYEAGVLTTRLRHSMRSIETAEDERKRGIGGGE